MIFYMLFKKTNNLFVPSWSAWFNGTWLKLQQNKLRISTNSPDIKLLEIHYINMETYFQTGNIHSLSPCWLF